MLLKLDKKYQKPIFKMYFIKPVWPCQSQQAASAPLLKWGSHTNQMLYLTGSQHMNSKQDVHIKVGMLVNILVTAVHSRCWLSTHLRSEGKVMWFDMNKSDFVVALSVYVCHLFVRMLL